MSWACDTAMPRTGSRFKRATPWWTQDLADLRIKIYTARRAVKILRRRRLPHDQDEMEGLFNTYREAKDRFRKEIAKAKTRYWEDLIGTLNDDPWGKSYQIVMNKLKHRVPLYLRRIVRSYLTERLVYTTEDGITEERTVARGFPQGSIVGLLLWDLGYNNVLKWHCTELRSGHRTSRRIRGFSVFCIKLSAESRAGSSRPIAVSLTGTLPYELMADMYLENFKAVKDLREQDLKVIPQVSRDRLLRGWRDWLASATPSGEFVRAIRPHIDDTCLYMKPSTVLFMFKLEHWVERIL
ncbi:hypothetical protein ALC57_16624 [Trachymyrmex cornetzi]|uniref:Reverse transcriptase domain-containing protein n=1 Tax=Trachymyrmex cornetzi TaxID=471704 RepID=A0A151IUQ0_9HYME|nr:hypothetical protein ALC57_16624 [Trachymyrmex cornetzi]